MAVLKISNSEFPQHLMDSTGCIAFENLSSRVEAELIFLLLNFNLKYKKIALKDKVKESFINLKAETVLKRLLKLGEAVDHRFPF
jgi:hypothetical protein